MFEGAVLLGNTERTIALETTKGNPINNVVGCQNLAWDILNRYKLFIKKYGQNWKERKPPTGIYNCAGHVWASRRTCILEPSDWNKIISDDGYRELGKSEQICPGDIVAYLDQDKKDEVLHVGIVFGLEEVSLTKPIPLIVSKWNETSGESLHRVHDHPYKDFNIRFVLYTDRPLSTDSHL